MIGNISKSKGFKGDRGDALTFDDLTPEQKQELSAKIVSVNASVDNTTGTPSVEVTMDGTEQDRNVSLAFSGLKGKQGEKGEKGDTGKQGNDGLSAYEVAVKNGFEGSEEEWLESLGDSEALNTHLQNVDNPHDVTAEKVGAYSKTEVDTKLGQKQDMYVMGHGNIRLIINGDAKFNGEVCGTYNAETDEMSYYTGDMWKDINPDAVDITRWPYIEWSTPDDYLELPIQPVNLKKGIYRISFLTFSGKTDDTFSSKALYKYNENGEVDDVYDDYVVEIGGYDFLYGDDSGYVEIAEDILVSSIKIKAKTLGMRMAQHTRSNVSGKNNWLLDSSGILVEYIELKNYIDLNDSDKAGKIDFKSLEERTSEFITETGNKIEEITTTLGTKANKSDIVSLYKFRGSVPTLNDLSDIYREEGYVYNVRDTGMNYAWNGTEWDALGGEHRDIEAHHRLDILGEQKADKSTTYTQTQIDDALNNKANKSEVYTKTEVSNMLNAKADKTEIIKNMISDGSNIAFNADKNTVGITKELGSFVCTAIDESTSKYTFDVADTSVFEPYTEYKVTVDETDYLIRTSKINEDNVVFVAVDEENKPTFDVGTAYNIRFETKNATSFGVDNTVYANEGFATGMANFIDETGDQGVANGYGNKLSGKAHLVAGSSNIVKGGSKFVAGIRLLAEKTLNGSAVLGKWNEDVQGAIFILGNGYDKDHRKNALVVDNKGNIIAYGTLTVDKDTVINGNLDVNGNVTITGAMKLNNSNVVTEEILSKHTGIDIGRKGEGSKSVIVNSNDNTADGSTSFTAGANNKTTKAQGATFGYGNENHGLASFIAGAYNKIISGLNTCIALGRDIVINAHYSAALGFGLVVNKTYQVVVGRNNKPDNTSVFIVGCGNDEQKNAITVEAGTGLTTICNDAKVNGSLYTNNISATNIAANGSIMVTGDVKVSGKVLGSNSFPKTLSFVINGDITNQNGTLVAKYDGNDVNFNLDKNEYPYNGRRIRDCQKLIIPIEPVTLTGCYKKGGSYGLTSSDSHTQRFTDNGYYLEYIPEGAVGVTETDDCYIVNEPLTVDTVYLKSDKVWSNDDYYWSWDFVGNGLYMSITQTSDITARSIGAATQNDIGDIETALDSIIAIQNELIGGDNA